MFWCRKTFLFPLYRWSTKAQNDSVTQRNAALLTEQQRAEQQKSCKESLRKKTLLTGQTKPSPAFSCDALLGLSFYQQYELQCCICLLFLPLSWYPSCALFLSGVTLYLLLFHLFLLFVLHICLIHHHKLSRREHIHSKRYHLYHSRFQQ